MRNEPSDLEAPTPLLAASPGPAGFAGRSLPMHDPEALGRLLLGLEPRLHAVATRITRNPESARDVVQNAFEKVLRHGGRFEGQSLVSTWLHRIVTNEALMWLRSHRRRSEVQSQSEAPQLELLPDAAASPAEQAEKRQCAAQLHRVLGQLGAEERDLLVRCGLHEESYESYSKRSGLHPGAVKTRAFRGRRRLHELLVKS